MSNRSQELNREIAFSESLSEEKRKAKPRHHDGWRSDLDAELTRFFQGDYVGAAGLRSGFGYQLERQRDGVSFTGPGFNAPQPPRGIEVGPGGRLEVNEVMAALLRIVDVAIDRVRGEVREKYKREANEEEILAAYDRARQQTEVLRQFYSKHPTEAYGGLLGLEPHTMTAVISAPIVKATKAWMREELAKELAHAASAAALSKTEAEERINAWQAERAEIAGNIEAYEQDGEPRLGKAVTDAVILLATRRAAMRRVEELDEKLRMATRLPERIDVEAIIRAKWEREPRFDECKARLREANERQKPSKVLTPELRGAAKKLVHDAVESAKRDLDAARAAYQAARESGRSERRDTTGKSREVRIQARIDAFDERLGLK
jgi:hypothetical protein